MVPEAGSVTARSSGTWLWPPEAIDGGGLEPSADSDGTRRPMAASNPHNHTVGGF
jgi:hypothetical protein